MAVVGSGPAGLACAAQLNRAGHPVTVFERADRVGGLLMYGIPNMKLDKGDRGAARGAAWPTRASASSPAPRWASTSRPTGCVKDYDAVVLCGGATTARDLPVEGRSLHGIHLAMEFLTQNTKSLLDSGLADGQLHLAPRASDVVVIGGGDTGTDCVGTSIRHGAAASPSSRSCRARPTARAADNPWPQWPKVYQHRLRPGGGRPPSSARTPASSGSRPRSSWATPRGA